MVDFCSFGEKVLPSIVMCVFRKSTHCLAISVDRCHPKGRFLAYVIVVRWGFNVEFRLAVVTWSDKSQFRLTRSHLLPVERLGSMQYYTTTERPLRVDNKMAKEGNC